MYRFASEIRVQMNNKSVPLKQINALVLRPLECDLLLHSHDLNMVEVLCSAANHTVDWINLAFFDDPTLCLWDDPLRDPAW